jgi:hypothetical protein
MHAEAQQRSTCVLHLVWAPLGPAMLEEFLSAYRAHDAGLEHTLVVLLNGFEGPDDRRLFDVEPVLEGVEHERVFTSGPVLDLEAYRQAATKVDARRLCFLNSYARPLAGGWLAALSQALDTPGAGLVGPSGSWGSIRSYNRFMLGLGGPYARVFDDRRATIATMASIATGQESSDQTGGHAPLHFARELLERSYGFRSFPAAHLRTSVFMLEADMLRDLQMPRLLRKPDALRLESGRDSITAQTERRGLRALVVGRDGESYALERWPASGTFWQRNQENLLIADKQSDDYELGDTAARVALSRYAWGDAADPRPAPPRSNGGGEGG